MKARKVTKERMAHRLAVECLGDAVEADSGSTRFEWIVVAEGDGCWWVRAFADGIAAAAMVNEHSFQRRYTNLYTAAEVGMFITAPAEWTDSEPVS